MRRLYAEGHRVTLMSPLDLVDEDWVAVVSNMGAPLPSPFPIEQLVAMRAHINQAAYWNTIYSQTQFLFFGSLLAHQRNHPDETVAYLKHNLSVFNDPIVTVIGNASSPNAHVILAYGYDANNIYF